MIDWTPLPSEFETAVSATWQRPELACLTQLLVAEKGFQVLLVGGAVRDILLGQSVKDYDILVTCSPQQLAELRPDLARQSGVTVFPLDLERGYFRVCYRESEGVDVAALDRPSVWHDLRRRDIAFNAMALDPMGRLADPFDGRSDLTHRRVRIVGEDVLEDDPLRVLRCLRLSATLDFEIEAPTLALLQKHAPNLERVAGERIQEELFRFLRTASPRQWAYLEQSRIVEAILRMENEQVPWRWLDGWWSEPPTSPRDDQTVFSLIAAALSLVDSPEKHLQRIKPSRELLRFCQRWWNGSLLLHQATPETAREIWSLIRTAEDALPELLQFASLPDFSRPVPASLSTRILDAASGRGELRREAMPLRGQDLCEKFQREPGRWLGIMLSELETAWVCREVDSREALLAYSVAILR